MEIIKRVNSARSLNNDTDRSKFQPVRVKPITPRVKNEVKRPSKTMILGKENKQMFQNLSKSRQLTCMDKQIKLALAVLKESGPANFERNLVIRKALQDKYTLSRSNSSTCLSKNAVTETSNQKQRRLSLLHPAAMRRQPSPKTMLKPEISALIQQKIEMEISRERSRRSQTPEGYDDVADELEDYQVDRDNLSPERTSNVKGKPMPKVFDQAYLSPSEVQAEIPSRQPIDSLFSDPVTETPVVLKKRCGREIQNQRLYQIQPSFRENDFVDEDENDSVAEFLRTENFAMTRDKVHASRMHLMNNTKPVSTQNTLGSAMKSGLSYFRNTLATYTSPLDRHLAGSDSEGSSLRMHKSDFRTTLMPQSKVKPFLANNSNNVNKHNDRQSGRSIALALKCAQLEGILKLSCCSAVKRIAYIECSMKKQVMQKLQANAKQRYIEYESLATSFVDGRASLKSQSLMLFHQSSIREDDNE